MSDPLTQWVNVALGILMVLAFLATVVLLIYVTRRPWAHRVAGQAWMYALQPAATAARTMAGAR
jgi:hypothetical protein